MPSDPKQQRQALLRALRRLETAPASSTAQPTGTLRPGTAVDVFGRPTPETRREPLREGKGISLIDKLSRQPIVKLAEQWLTDAPLTPLDIVAGYGAIKAAREGLKMGVGRVVTNLRRPQGYYPRLFSYTGLEKPSVSLKDAAMAVVKDEPLWADELKRGLGQAFRQKNSRTGLFDPHIQGYSGRIGGEAMGLAHDNITALREVPYRRMFGLKPRFGTEEIYTEVAPGILQFNRQHPLGEAIYQNTADRMGFTNHGVAYGAPLMGDFHAARRPGTGAYRGFDIGTYRDRWDFDLNPGEVQRFTDRIIDTYHDGRARYSETIPKSVFMTLREMKARGEFHELKAMLLRKGVSSITDPVTFVGPVITRGGRNQEMIQKFGNLGVELRGPKYPVYTP